jgi:DNA-directed RNA polymerase II subunit RPB1
MLGNSPISTSSRISSIRLRPVTEQEIVARGVEITSFKQFSDGEPVAGGTYDSMMGSIFERYNCGSCGLGLTKCPGHHGYYALKFPVQYMIYEKLIIKHLRLICVRCFRYICDPSLYTKKPSSNDVMVVLKYMADVKLPSKKKIFCDHCNEIADQASQGIAKTKYVIKYVQPKYKKSQGDPIDIGYVAQRKFKDGKDGKYANEDKNHYVNMIYNDEILRLFEKLPDSELTKFGMPVQSHPRHMLTRYLHILPVNMRFINNDNKQSYNNQITTSYEKIIKEDIKIRPTPSKSDTISFSEYISEVKSMAARYREAIRASGDKPNKTDTIVSILTGGKKGIIRKDMLAKQVGNIIRDVIVCIPMLPVDTIQIPMELAMELAIQVHVTPYNVGALQKYVDNGEKYPGCNMIKCRDTGAKKSTKYLNNYKLKVGDIIYRHMIDGDPLPFHRHPTLTPTCIIATKVKINTNFNDKPIGMNDALCSPFNADFDGDQMNGYNVTGEKERIETKEIMKLQNMFPEARVSVGGNYNTLGQIQDAVIGISLLTMPGVELSRFETMQLFRDLNITINFDKPTYTGREIFSMLLPKINYTAKSPIAKNDMIVKYLGLTENDTKIVIKRGKIISGVICDSIIKDGYGSLYHTIYHMYGSDVAIKTIHKHQQLARRFLEIKSYTIGFKDILYGKETEKLINLVQGKIMAKLSELDNMLLHRKLVPPIGKTMREHVLDEISKIHASSENAYLGAILQTVSPLENNIFKSIIFGAKGKLSNIYAIMACVGMIKLDGKFIPQSLDIFRHSIFHKQFSSEPSAFGYVHESYKQGISHANIHNTASAARQNILTKSMGTGEAGAEGRNSIKIFEPIIVTNNQHTARNHSTIVEFAIGDDGFESILCMQNDYSGIQVSDDDLRAKMQPTKIKHKSIDEYIEIIIQDKHRYIEYNQTREKIGFMYKCDYKLVTPGDYNMIINHIVQDVHPTTEKELISMISTMNEWIENVHYCRYNPVLRKNKREMMTALKTAFNSVRIATRYFLNPRFLETCSPTNLQIILKTLEIKIIECSYTPGKNIGTVIGQTLTAPFTQYLIDAHHQQATGGTSKDGLKYFKAIMSLKDIDTILQKRMYIYLKPKYEEDKQVASDLANYITSKPLSTFINKSYVIQEKYGDCQAFPGDKTFHANKLNGVSLYGIFFRYTLNHYLMKMKDTDIVDVCIKIEQHFNGQVYCIYSPKPINGELILCMYFNTSFDFAKQHDFKVTDERDFWMIVEEFRKKFNGNFITNNVPGIKNSVVKSKEIISLDKSGQIIKKTIHYIQTDGIELEHILRINVVDKSRTSCSHIRKSYELYGTVSGKEVCISELMQTLATLGLAYNNFTFLANVMFENGSPDNLGEIGQKKREPNDVFIRMATKNPIAAVASGSINAVDININSPTANLMCGQVPRIGTNYNQICYNPEMIASTKNEEDDLI